MFCQSTSNACLAQRKEAYETEKKTISKIEQLRLVKELKASNPYAGKVHSHVLQNVVQDLDKAFKAFFRRIKAGETPGYPRFKGKNRWKSFGFKEYGNGFKIDGRRLRLFGVGRVVVRWHRPIEGRIKTVRIIKKAGKWYACFACEIELNPLPPTGKEIGIDVGIASLLTTSDGEKIENPRWYQNQQRKLRVLQRRVSRRKLGSYNRRKAVLALQRQHEHIANSRKDFLDKLVYWLITNYDRIALEDLRILNMVKNHKLSKSILDASWGYLIQKLLDKAEEAGRVVSLVNPAYTSKTCSNCGFLFEHLSLKDRWIDCSCGFSACRDWNASLNLLRLGRSLWELSSTVVGFS
ncbi:transposase [Pleurocapsa sp. CCALA 161]|uniref:RNA-guided endonuclease InsQ/TnpB family protein n=1 Tax=Pleurocapsa sp. CCALA 161 TaxID=2107688 RepID=UPI000D04F725|nr:RNA-guided endonuclease TnpB family protein [Pleurocapsa sp. CCALA 161]PSB07861.1 transposase [Pleurocapsa sp. CCALA 161]